MRRTLLLTLALPAVLIASGAGAQLDDETPSALTVSRSTDGSTADSAASPADPSGGTSDGAAAPTRLSVGDPAPPAADPAPPRPVPGGSAATADPDPAPLPPTPVLSAEGFLVAPGGSVSGTGSRWRYTIEVEPATGLDLDDVRRDVVRALHDPRSWAAGRTLEQVGDPTSARIRLVVATPETVDRLCAEVGLRTAGIYSCWNGRFAALNAWRWEVGATGFADMQTYRTYLVNHEFGHGLGYGHVGCPSAGAPAPVMMQQSKDLGDCEPNGWPYP